MNGADVIIRPVREADAAAIVEILNAIVRAGIHSAMTAESTPADQVRFIRELPAAAVYLAAFRDGTLVGTQDVLPAAAPRLPSGGPHSPEDPVRVGEISTFIAEGARRTGIGRRLLRATLEAARDGGYGRIHAVVRADNAAAQAFYGRHGFVRDGTVSPYATIAGRPVDGVRWMLELD